MKAEPSSSDADEYATSSVLWQGRARPAHEQDSLVAVAYEALWKQIVEGERQPGERLIAGELAHELKISRTPVQQALYQLQQAGLVEASVGRGFAVVIFSAEDIRDLYDLRIILEVAAVRAAAPHIPAPALESALALIDELRGTPEPELGPRFLHSDVQLHHELIAGHCGNRRLAEAVAHQRAQMSLFLVGGTRLLGGVAAALDEHAAIVHALQARDAEQAALAIEQHIQRVKRDALRQLGAARQSRVRRFRPS